MDKVEIRSLHLSDGQMSSIDDLNVQGYVATNQPSHILGKPGKRQWREMIVPNVFKKAIERRFESGLDIEFILNHDKSKLLASTKNESLYLEEDEVGLFIDATISPTTWGKDTFVLIKDKIIDGLSFGMKVLKEDWSFKDGLPLRTILEIELFEISALDLPAYPSTYLEARGLEIAEVVIPNDIEERNMEGGNQMNENMEVTPKMIYDGMTLIANKLDTIIGKFDLLDRNRAIEGVDDAKELLAKVEVVVDKLASNTEVKPVEETADVEEPLEKTDETTKEAEDDSLQMNDSKDEEKTDSEDEMREKEVEEELEDGEEDLKPEDVEKEDVITEEESEKQMSDEKTLDEDKLEKDKNKIKEFRSLIKTLTQEVPEIE